MVSKSENFSHRTERTRQGVVQSIEGFDEDGPEFGWISSQQIRKV